MCFQLNVIGSTQSFLSSFTVVLFIGKSTVKLIVKRVNWTCSAVNISLVPDYTTVLFNAIERNCCHQDLISMQL